MFGGWLQGLYNITPPTPTGDMQDGMDAVMPMAMPAANPAAPAANAPQTLPNTGGESPQSGWGLLALGIVALLSGGLLLRRGHHVSSDRHKRCQYGRLTTSEAVACIIPGLLWRGHGAGGSAAIQPRS